MSTAPTFSESFVAREVFSAIWSLGILSALGNADAIHIPFDHQLMAYVSEKQTVVDGLFESVRTCCGISKAAMVIAVEDAPWTLMAIGSGRPFLDRVGLDAELGLASRRLSREQDLSTFAGMRKAIADGIENQLREFLVALMTAHYCFRDTSVVGDFWSCCKPVFVQLQLLLGKASSCPDGESLRDSAIQIWMNGAPVEAALAIARDDGFRDWLREQLSRSPVRG